MFVRNDHRLVKVEFALIRYAEACKNYCKIYTTGKTYLIQTTLSLVKAALPPGEFCRIHRSFIVSLAHLESFDKKAVYLSDCHLPIGASYQGMLEQAVPILATMANRKRTGDGPPEQQADRLAVRMMTPEKGRSVKTDLR
jgi:hypothetical protein